MDHDVGVDDWRVPSRGGGKSDCHRRVPSRAGRHRTPVVTSGKHLNSSLTDESEFGAPQSALRRESVGWHCLDDRRKRLTGQRGRARSLRDGRPAPSMLWLSLADDSAAINPVANSDAAPSAATIALYRMDSPISVVVAQ